MTENPVIRRFTLDAISWTPITAPQVCDYVILRCDTAFKVRTISSDPTTEEQGLEFTVSGARTAYVRFKPGDTIFYAQAVSGTVTVILRSDQ